MTTVCSELSSSDTFIKKMKLLGRSSDSNVVNLSESFKKYDAIYISYFQRDIGPDRSRISASIFAFSEDINVGDKIMLIEESNGSAYQKEFLTISSETSFTVNYRQNTTVIGINL